MKKKRVNWSFNGPTHGSNTTGSFEVPYDTTDEEILEMVEDELSMVFNGGGVMHKMRSIEEYENLLTHMTGGPWRVEVNKNNVVLGENWLVAEFGLSPDGTFVFVTTDGVPASAANQEPEADALFLVEARNVFPEMLQRLKKSESLNCELLEVLDTVLVNWGMPCTCDKFTSECESCYRKNEIKRKLAEVE